MEGNVLGKIATFYSYKGGVGRTMALANVAVLLGRRDNLSLPPKSRVLIIDWDLEAPGLDKYFLSLAQNPSKNSRIEMSSPPLVGGLVSILNAMQRREQPNWRDYCQKVTYTSEAISFELSAIFSGETSENYSTSLQSLSWDLFFSEAVDGGARLEVFREELRNNFDFVLIDSRTGATDSGGVCTVLLPDILVLNFTANEQSIVGCKKVGCRIQEARKRIKYDRLQATIIPLLNRWDNSEADLAKQWFERSVSEFADFLNSWVPNSIDKRSVLYNLQVPYVPKYSFGECLAVVDESLENKHFPGYYYANLAEILESLSGLDAYWNRKRPLKQTGTFQVPQIEGSAKFVGRRKELQILQDWISSTSSNQLAIIGDAGIGKTRLAFEFCNLRRVNAQATWFVRSESRDHVASELVRLLGNLIDSVANLTSSVVDLLRFTVRTLDRLGPWLIVFDEVYDESLVDDVIYVMESTTQGKVLFTSRHLTRKISPTIELGIISNEEALALVRSLDVPKSDLSDEFILSVAGATPGLLIAVAEGLPIDWSNRVSNMFARLTLTEAESLKRLSMLAPKPIAKSLADCLCPSQMQQRLSAKGLLFTPSLDTAQIPLPVREFARQREGNDLLDTTIYGVIHLLSEWSPSPRAGDLLNWAEHISFLFEICVTDFQSSPPDLNRLMLQLASECYANGDFPECERMLRMLLSHLRSLRMLLSYSRTLPENSDPDPKRFDESSVRDFEYEVLCCLCEVLVQNYEFDEAEREARTALELVGAVSQTENDDSSKTDLTRPLMVLFRIMVERANFEEAENAINRAIDATEKSHGRNSPEALELIIQRALTRMKFGQTAATGQELVQLNQVLASAKLNNRSIANFASIRSALGDNDGGIELLQRVIADEQRKKAEHPNLAVWMNNLGVMLRTSGRLQDAILLQRRALEIDEACYGQNHPAVAIDLCNLAEMYQDIGDFIEAESLLRKSLTINRSVLGVEHPATLRDLNNLGMLLFASGKTSEAQTELRRALASTETLANVHLFDTLRKNLQLVSATSSDVTSNVSTEKQLIAISKKTMNNNVFISYSRRNLYIAERVCCDLRKLGVPEPYPWFDQRDIPLNSLWEKQIEEAIEKCDRFLYLWSPEAQASEYVQWEYQLAKKLNRDIAIARVAGSPSQMSGDLQALQHRALGENYWKEIEWLAQNWLGLPSGSFLTSRDVVELGEKIDGAVSAFAELHPRSWRVFEQQSKEFRRFLRMPVLPGGYAASWLVVEAGRSVSITPDLHVILKFSGDRHRDVVQEVIEYLVGNQIQPHVLFIEGPVAHSETNDKKNRGYDIPNDKPHIWQECVDLAVKSILECRGARKLHFFLDSPQAIVFPLAGRLREKCDYSVYNLDANATNLYRYSCVYEANPN